MDKSALNERIAEFRKMTAPPAAMLETMAGQLERFWLIQDHMLDAMQDYADGWIKRRHEGTQAATEAARRMCGAEGPIDFFREQQDWFNCAAKRLAADGAECQKQWTRIASQMFKPAEVAGRSEEPAAPTSKAPTRAPAQAA